MSGPGGGGGSRALSLLLARALLCAAAALMPPEKAGWARAMRAEFDHAAAHRQPLDWALGCVGAAFNARMESMKLGNLVIARWVLAAEMLLCYAAPTLAVLGAWVWLDELAHLVRLDPAHFHKYFLADKAGLVALVEMTTMGPLSLCGPVGLLVAGRYLLGGKAGGPRWLQAFLLWSPIIMGVIMVAARLFNGGLADFRPDADSAFDAWSGLILLSLLPAAAAMHLRRLACAPLSPFALETR